MLGLLVADGGPGSRGVSPGRLQPGWGSGLAAAAQPLPRAEGARPGRGTGMRTRVGAGEGRRRQGLQVQSRPEITPQGGPDRPEASPPRPAARTAGARRFAM